ncbi:MAG TPA: tyrosine-type recombinase/integrase, partial [Rhodospirillales bacterium]|nr:tyrosine-type recombinase/integrase [Rhodospirillales bacterium]
VLMGAFLGQREGDILRLTWAQYDGSMITLRQSKTGAVLTVPVASQLKTALDEALTKLREAGAVDGRGANIVALPRAKPLTRRSVADASVATPTDGDSMPLQSGLDGHDARLISESAPAKASPVILISETTTRPYKADHFRHEFRRIAKAAGIGLQFLDLRRSAVVHLAEADCTIPQISAITGHQLDRTTRILETYLPRTAPMAKAAILKLELYRKRTKLEF